MGAIRLVGVAFILYLVGVVSSLPLIVWCVAVTALDLWPKSAGRED